jgi:antitoxin component of MazEF toxin-antitoxin module
MIYNSKVRRIGNSQGIIIPAEAKKIGFSIGQLVQLDIQNDKITVTLRPMKEYNSLIKDIKKEGLLIHPIHFNKNESKKSTRFEKIFSIDPGSNLYYEFYYDHLEEMYLGFIREGFAEAKWHGKYLSDEAYKEIRNGADPYKYLSL